MDTGAVVSFTAISGIETRKIPSAKLLEMAADQSRLKAGENVLIETLLASLDYVRRLLSRYLLLPFPSQVLD